MSFSLIFKNCNGNISLEQIKDGLRVVNDDFRRINSDTSATRAIFKPFAGDAEIIFKLAQKDPNGNCTEGVNRINTLQTYDAQDNVKGLSYWPSSKYLNVWLVESIASSSGVILGYAQFPGFGSWNTYGLVVRNDQWGTIGSSNADGRTPTHEIGHCLGLYHTFQGGCGGSCSNSGDRICDTPPVYDATWSCSSTQNTCSNDASGPSAFTSNVVDQIENYMSYDNCQNMFTLNQITVMRDVFTKYNTLASLVSSSNLTATGTNPGFVPVTCKPKSDFCQPEVDLCEGNSLTFTDNSFNGAIASRTWSFPGGSPASSSDSIVTVTYNTSGNYDVTLNVGNAAGTNSKTLTKVVNVISAEPDHESWRYDESFENAGQFDSLWTIDNSSGGRKWELTQLASYTGLNSAHLYNNINGTDLTDAMISPSYNLSEVNLPTLRFKGAYAMKSSTSQDFLRIYYSYNCGYTWSIMSVMTGGLLTSVPGYVTSDFIPANASEWRDFSFTFSSFVADKTNVRIKFEFTSGGGNNIYIDDINIESATGIDESDLQSAVRIYPNPVTERIFIEAGGSEKAISEIFFTDLSGRKVMELKREEVEFTNGVAEIPTEAFRPGLYLINILSENGLAVVRKVIIR